MLLLQVFQNVCVVRSIITQIAFNVRFQICMIVKHVKIFCVVARKNCIAFAARVVLSRYRLKMTFHILMRNQLVCLDGKEFSCCSQIAVQISQLQAQVNIEITNYGGKLFSSKLLRNINFQETFF